MRHPSRLQILAVPVLLAALFATPFVAPAQADDLRLGTAVRPDFQRVQLDLDPAESAYSGSVHVDLTVVEETASFLLHSQEHEITSLVLRDAAGEKLSVSHRSISGERLEVTAGEPLTPGLYNLEIDFTADFGTRAVGLYKAEHDGNDYLFTQFQAVDARRAFPVWDEPAAKIPYQLVLTVPEEDMAVTNAPEVARHVADGRARVTFARTRPLPSYLLALAVGPFESRDVEGMGIPARALAPAGLGHMLGTAVEVTPPIPATLEEYFGRPYPYAKLDLIAVPEFWPGAMENAGLITFADHILLKEPGSVSAGQLRSLVRVNAHELAHMWFGDLVTMAWWDDLWLNESFADWLAFRVTDDLYPNFESDLSQLRGVQGILGVDARPTTEAIRQPITHAADAMRNVGLAYAKGRAVLGMVERWLGPEVFRRGIRTYIDANVDGNTEAADLWSTLSEVSGEDVEAVLSSFVDQPGYPLLAATPGDDGSVTLTQTRFLNHGNQAPAQTWRLPVGLTYSRDGEVESRDLLLTGATIRVELGPGVDWVMPNSAAAGYYRWSVPEEMLLTMAGEAAGALSPAERIAFLGNAAALLDAGVVGGDTYLRVINAFADDPHPDVVSALVGNLGKVEQAFVPDELAPSFAAYVRRTLEPALERFGLEPRPGEAESVALFRPQLLAWLGDEGEHPEVMAYAQRLAAAYLADPASVDPALAGLALGLAAKDGDVERFETYRRRFEESKSPLHRGRFLAALGAFDDPAVQERALTYALEGPLRPTELFTIPGGVADSPGGGERLFEWFLEHYDAFAGRMPPEFVAFMPGIAGGCSEERLERAREFFSQPEHRVEGTDVQMAKTARQVMDCVELRRREGDVVAAYLSGLEGGGSGSSARTVH